jgi:hypothetical protein
MSHGEPLPAFLFAGKSASERRHLARWKAAGRIRSIGPRLYTSLPKRGLAVEVRKSWLTILEALYPDALVSHRTALAFDPDRDGYIFVTANTNRTVDYAGLRVEFIRGPAPRRDDRPFFRTLRASSRPRAFLENLSKDARRAHARTLTVEEVERRLDQMLRDGGEASLNDLRDHAKTIAAAFGWNAELERLGAMIGALLGTRSPGRLIGAGARARAAGVPFDADCVERLQLLTGELRGRDLAPAADVATSAAHFNNKAFFEAYFSNYIEGTRFAIDEAASIVFEKRIPAARPIDAHDITGTFAIVSDPTEMRRTPATADELVLLLRSRHATMLADRPRVHPGMFKTARNFAGETEFVRPDEVVGTLRHGLDLYVNLPAGLPRAIFMMFLVADVHPFADGNGRVARIMMNAELLSARTSTIIIPTVFRDDYLQTLGALTRQKRTTPLVDALVKAWRFSRLDFADYPRVLAEMRRRFWFADPDDARIDAS